MTNTFRGLNACVLAGLLAAATCSGIAQTTKQHKKTADMKAQAKSWPWMDTSLTPDQRADMVMKEMTLDEKLSLLHGNGMAHEAQWQMPLTNQSNGGAGYIAPIERLGIPGIDMSDAAYGVRSSGNNGRYSTALPSNVGAAASWDRKAAWEYGALIGRELRAQGYNMTLGGGVNLTREPRNGRTFEYLGEDPILAGTLVGQLMTGEQAQHVIGDIKHYAINDQETGRTIVNTVISKRAMRESDLLAFQIGIRDAQPGAVMCSYNRINLNYACENDYLLKEVLKERLQVSRGLCSLTGAATHSTIKASHAGLDHEEPMDKFSTAPKLKQAVAEQASVASPRLDDHAHRHSAFLLRGWRQWTTQSRSGVIDVERDLDVAQHVEEGSIVLLKNEKKILPSREPSMCIPSPSSARMRMSACFQAEAPHRLDPPGGNAISCHRARAQRTGRSTSGFPPRR